MCDCSQRQHAYNAEHGDAEEVLIACACLYSCISQERSTYTSALSSYLSACSSF